MSVREPPAAAFGIKWCEVVLGERETVMSRSSVELELEAARQCLTAAGISPYDIDLVIVASLVPEFICPGNAGIISRRLGMQRALALNVEAGRDAFISATSVALRVA